MCGMKARLYEGCQTCHDISNFYSHMNMMDPVWAVARVRASIYTQFALEPRRNGSTRLVDRTTNRCIVIDDRVPTATCNE